MKTKISHASWKGVTLAVTVSLLMSGVALSGPTPTPTSTPCSLVVTNTLDSGYQSLRDAIVCSNNTPGTDTISFNIPGVGVHTISPVSALPAITGPVIIDGYTQPGSSPNTLATGSDAVLLIELNGSSAGGSTDGLIITAGNSTVRGLVINRFTDQGILLQTAGGNTITGCYIGTNAAGTTDLGNTDDGIRILSGSANNTIGGSTSAARNVISGNNMNGVQINGDTADNNAVQGNYIGTDVTGTVALGNGANGIIIAAADNTVLGGAVATTGTAPGNVISGNGSAGISILTTGGPASGTSIKGNLIGTNAAGTADLGNSADGVVLGSANTVGGTAAGERNVISGNNGDGVQLSAGNCFVFGNFIGTNAAGTAGIPNTGAGVLIVAVSGNQVGGTAAGEANLIAFGSGNGVSISTSGTGNRISGNSIHSNGSTANHLGINLIGALGVNVNDAGDPDTGPNNLQNYPVLASASSSGGNTTITGTLNSTASTAFNIEFFSNPSCDTAGNGEGKVYLGSTSVTTNGSGNASFNTILATATTVGHAVTATATDPAGDTSEFSMCSTAVATTPTPSPTPTSTATATATATSTATSTATATATDTPTPTATATDTPTPTATATATDTPTPTATATDTPTPTATATATDTPTPTATATDTPTPTATATATDTPTPTPINISGTISYCSNPVPGPVPNVTLNLSGDTIASSLSNGSGSYTLSSLPSGGSYIVTPAKSALAPGSAGINTVDVIATQRHFLNVTPLTPGCRLTAADVSGDTAINTVDVIAIQRFFLGLSTGIANTGKYQFAPTSRAYPGIASDQTAQDYDTLVFGDVASSFVAREGGPLPTEAGEGTLTGHTGEVSDTVDVLCLPDVALDQLRTPKNSREQVPSRAKSMPNFNAAVTTSAIDAKNRFIGFQGDFTFDERVVTFQSEPVQKAGITGGNWNVSGNVLSGTGPIRTLRISAYSNDFTPLSGTGTLFELRMRAVSDSALRIPNSACALLWAPPPDQFIFIDADLKTSKPGYAAPGSVTRFERRN